jgi:cytochrome c-type biogenesis protein CcmH/NrfF
VKTLAILLFIAAGATGLLAITVVQKTVAPGLGTYFGAFAIPALLAWWGKIALDKSRAQQGEQAPTLETHVRCPECRELVRSDAKLCKQCGTKLTSGEA